MRRESRFEAVQVKRKDRQAGFLCRLEQQVIAPVGVQRVNSARQQIDGDDVLVTGMAALFSRRRIVRLDDNRALQSIIRIEPLVDHPAIKGTRQLQREMRLLAGGQQQQVIWKDEVEVDPQIIQVQMHLGGGRNGRSPIAAAVGKRRCGVHRRPERRNIKLAVGNPL